MRRHTHLAAITALLLLIGASVALAQTGGGYDLTWSTIDSGGGTSTGGSFTLSGTTGQPDAGTLSGGPFTLRGGFWGAADLTPTPSPTPNPCTATGRVNVASTANGDGRLRVVVSATGPNTLQTIAFNTDAHAVGNGLIDAPAPATPALSAAAPPTSITLPASTATYTFYVRRASAGAAVAVPIVVTDNCGTWPSLVGGGPSAF